MAHDSKIDRKGRRSNASPSDPAKARRARRVQRATSIAIRALERAHRIAEGEPLLQLDDDHDEAA